MAALGQSLNCDPTTYRASDIAYIQISAANQLNLTILNDGSILRQLHRPV